MSKLRIVNRYWSIPNSILNNEELSLKAKWLFWYIQSKPDDWDFSAERIAKGSKDWLDSVTAWLKELEINWFLERIKYKNELWHWEIDYVLHESSINENWKPSIGNSNVGNTINNSKKEYSNTSNSAIATFDVEKFQIKEETPKKKSRAKRSSFIREGSDTIWASYIPPTKLMLEERLWQKRWVDKFYQILILDNMKDTKIFKLDNPDDPLSFTKLISLYEWMIEFFKEKYDWKIYKDSEWRTVGSDIIFNVLDTFIAHYMENKKWEDILNLEARLRTWIINSLKYS